jgi:hypothetical protein
MWTRETRLENLSAGAKHGGGQHQSALTQVVIAEAVGAMAEHAMGPLGQVGTVGTIILNAVRQAGLKRVDDLVTDAMLNPGLAKTLLMKVQTPQQAGAVGSILSQQLRGLSLKSTALASQLTARQIPQASPQNGRQQPSYRGLATPPPAPPASDFYKNRPPRFFR